MINLGYFFGCCRSLLIFDLVIVNRRGSLYMAVDCCKSLLIISWLLSVLVVVDFQGSFWIVVEIFRTFSELFNLADRCGLSSVFVDSCWGFWTLWIVVDGSLS